MLVSDNLDSACFSMFVSSLVTGKVLQALIDGVFIVTPTFIDELSAAQQRSSLLFQNPLLFAPIQTFIQFDVSPNSQRTTLFQNFTFHFCVPSSPYIEIVRLAQGSIYPDECCVSAPSDLSVVVFQDTAASSESGLMSTQTGILERILQDDVLEWVRKGWIPLEEQEVMQCVLYPKEMESMVKLSRKRKEMEIEKWNEMKENQEMEMEMKSTTSDSNSSNQTKSEHMKRKINHKINHPLKEKMNHQMNHERNIEMNYEMNHTINEEFHNSLPDPYHNSSYNQNLPHSNHSNSRQSFNLTSAHGQQSMTAVPAVSIAVKRPGPVKNEEDIDDFFNALESGSQMAVESQSLHQSKRLLERKEEKQEDIWKGGEMMTDQEEMDLMEEVDRMEKEMEIEAEKQRLTQSSQSKNDLSSQLSSQTRTEGFEFTSQHSLNQQSFTPKPATTSKEVHSASTSQSASIEQHPSLSVFRESSQSSSTGRSSNTVKLLDVERSCESPLMPRKGKRFVKHAVKKSSNIISLTPYLPSRVCHKHSIIKQQQLFLSFFLLPEVASKER